MTEALFPPDKKPGLYWIAFPDGVQAIREWTGDVWHSDAFDASFMRRVGYRLASPHPIPGPEQLNALHALKEEIVQIGAEMTDSMSARTVLHGIVNRLGQRLSVVIEGKP